MTVTTTQPAVSLQKIVHPADWKGADMLESGDYIYRLSDAEISDIDQAIRGVEAEVGFASVGIKTVTCEAVIRKQGTDVRVEPNWLGCCDCGEGDQDG